MHDFRWIVLIDVDGTATPIATLMAPTRVNAERRAKALYTAGAWVQSEASHTVGRDHAYRIQERFREEDRRWRYHRFKDEEED